tara:strand:+ start:2165 stop:2590 length:426 start_codon:yes stop_codon:yes gene_type:complete
MIMKTNLRPFHLAIPVSNLEKSMKFYTNILGCTIGRSSEKWIDLNFFNHQLVLHLSEINLNYNSNKVDNKKIPIPHFGVILSWNEWQILSKKIKDKISFIIEPYIRFKGQIGEQATMFFLDPDSNALEFKSFKDDKMIFEK